MARICKIQILDEVNIRLVGLDDYTLDKAIKLLTFTVKNSHFMEKVRAKRWSGKIALLYKTGKTFRHLLPKIMPVLTQAGYVFAIEDKRLDYTISVPEIQNNLFEGYQHKRFKGFMEAHQVDAINRVTSHGGGLVLLPTASGKTIVTAGLAQLYYQFGKVLIIVPRQDLALETRDTIRAMGMADCGAFFDEVKEPSWVTVTTWQSLEARPELFQDVQMVLVDECHGASAKVIHELLTGAGKHVPVRIGMTGTMPSDDLSKFKIMAAIGPVIYEKKARELQDKGFLARCFIWLLQYQDRHIPAYTAVRESHKYYTDEATWQYTFEPRLEHLAASIRTIMQTGNTLILLRYRDYGEALHKLIPGSVYLNGDDKGSHRHKVYQEVNQSNNTGLICTYGIASTGIDVPRLFNVVLIEPGKEAIPIVQSIGRGLRKADDKNRATIFHVSSNCKFSERHMAEVQKIYRQHEYPFEVVEVDYG